MEHNNKLKSRKLWITLWAVAMVSYIVIAGKAEFLQLATLLSTVPLAYIGCSTWQKNVFMKSIGEKDGEQ